MVVTANPHANGDSVPYFAAAEQGQLLFQRCATCSVVQFPPRHHCASCWSDALEWTRSDGLGQVESFTIVRRAPLQQFRDRVPYVIAAIRLREGPRMITTLVGEDALAVAIGDPVSVEFQQDAGGVTLPVFRRT